jgi:hypothetical protein
MASGYSATALGVLYIALVRNLKKDYRQHRDFGEQIKYWADLVRDHGLDPETDDFAGSVLALEFLYSTQRQRIDAMHLAIADVLTRLADTGQTGGFRWSNCDFAAFQDIIRVAERPDLGSLSLGEVRRGLGGDARKP